MTYVTNYETRDGKTRRVEDPPPAPPAPPGEGEQASAPESKAGAEKNQAPDRPAKQGA
jgi:hypothetical protein